MIAGIAYSAEIPEKGQQIAILTDPRHGGPQILVGVFLCRDGDDPQKFWVRTTQGHTYRGRPVDDQLPLFLD